MGPRGLGAEVTRGRSGSGTDLQTLRPPLPPRPGVTSAPSHLGPNHLGPRHLGPSHFGPSHFGPIVTSAPSHMGPIFYFE